MRRHVAAEGEESAPTAATEEASTGGRKGAGWDHADAANIGNGHAISVVRKR